MKRLSFFLFLFPILAFCQDNAIICGVVHNAVSRDIQLIVDREYLDNTTTTFGTQLVNGNQFYFSIPIERSHLVHIKYARNYAEVYTEPGDSVYIEFDANNFQYSMKCSGKGGENNNFLNQFKAQFPEETNKFRLIGYRKGIATLEVEEKVNSHMFELTEGTFAGLMEKERTEKILEMDMHASNDGKLSSGFKSYLWSEIYYDWGYKMLAYGYLFPRKVSPEYWNFLSDVPIENDLAISNPKYRKYLVVYMNYLYQQSKSTENPYVAQYNLARTKLTDKVLYFFQSYLLDKAFRRGFFEEVLSLYNEFILENPYEEFDSKAIDAYYFANKYAIGSPAPDFDLLDIDGNPISLSGLNGKFIYLDFWATWCRPCIAKLATVKHVEQSLDPEQIVFVHLSLERDEERWRDQVAFRNLSGRHAFLADGLDNQLIIDYNIGAIPEYFIIDPNGNFAPKSEKNDAYYMIQHLESLIAEH